jgi:hypothetical protein
MMFSIKLTNLDALRTVFILLGIVSLTSGIPAANTVTPVSSSTVSVLVSSSLTSSDSLTSSSSFTPSSSLTPSTVGVPAPSSLTYSSTTAVPSLAPNWDYPGFLNISSLCDFDVWHSISFDGNNNNAKWEKLLPEGTQMYYTEFQNDTESIRDDNNVTYYYGFSKRSDGIGSFTQLAVTWRPMDNLITYDLSQHAGNATSPFMMDGYQAYPEQLAPTGQFPYCGNITCAAREHPCIATYMQGKYKPYRY